MIAKLLAELNIHPVLIDVGASGGTPAIWTAIASGAIYVGFDPDLREIRDLPEGQFYQGKIVNAAVSSSGQDTVTFHLTHSPYCSSTLQPDSQSLSNFLFADLFVLENTRSVKAMSLAQVLEQLALPGIDWLKIDSQGTDLRIFTALPPQLRSHVLALDIEPGLINAYIGEDSFIDAHRELTRAGFWLSNISVPHTARMRRATLEQLLPSVGASTIGDIQSFIPKSPGWCESRYLRSLEWVADSQPTQREVILLWAFALLDNQPGFALDVVQEYTRRFGSSDGLGGRLQAVALQQLKAAIARGRRIEQAKALVRPLYRRLRRK